MNVINNIKNYILGGEKPPSPEGHSVKSLSSTDKKVSMIFSDHILSDVNKVDLPDSTVQKTDSMATPSLKNRMYSLVARAWNGLHEAVEYVFSQHIKSEDRIEGLPHYEHEVQGSDKSELEELKKMLKPELGAEVERLFFEEITSNGPNAFADMYLVLEEAGAKVSDFSKDDLAELKAQYLISRNSDDFEVRDQFFDVLYEILLVNKFNEDDLLEDKEVNKFLEESYLVELGIDHVDYKEQLALSPLLAVLNISKNDNSNFSNYIKKRVYDSISKKIEEALEEIIEEMKNNIEDFTSSEIEEGIEILFSSLSYLSKLVSPFDARNMIIWENINNNFSEIINLKFENNGELVNCIDRLLVKHRDFAEDVVSSDYFYKGSDLVEASKRLLDRSSEEINKIKERNRQKVADHIINSKIEEITLDDIEKLHSINNADIVPKHFSKIRKVFNYDIFDGSIHFGERVGVHSEDVNYEMSELLSRINIMIKKNREKPVSSFQWSLQVAKIHNDFFEIHPFWDRNGSTGILLVELLMKEKGYIPSRERVTIKGSRSYFHEIRKILGNPIAALIVLGVQIRMANVPGFYKSKSLHLSKEKQRYYAEQMKEKKWFRYTNTIINEQPIVKKINKIFLNTNE